MSVREGKTSHINGIWSQKVGYALKKRTIKDHGVLNY